ncbi:acylneuraminate cytidylyltransferase family protein [Clostridium tetani]|nr:acylneuraminate cytidylyltransferase [Clostridium tetani]RXI52239.1 acylneuraminate cytidylyltransferase family protein [Clostridium tetani]RXI54009.1 acylneuraminate cytidylyltransferase family protein [Clostridium tetani]RXM58375.1 acylneuraminate cytidylyltransferase family protein [Clostridium tetani]RXM69163.1 acylneuraminate cytidylyltransferase family protein [Clostridium tetani]
MGNKTVIAIIPARGGSKGVKRKNLKELGDKPLINWTIEEAKKSKYIDKVIVSTEDNEIREVAEKSRTCVIKRPMELALDNSLTIDSIVYTLDKLKKEKYIPNYVVLLQCTSPFRTSRHIDEAIEFFNDNKEKADSLISVVLEKDVPYWLKSIDDNGFLKDFIKYDKKKFNKRQDFEKIYRLNGSIYIAKTDKIYKNESFESEKTISYVMDEKSSIDIDTEEDFEYAEFILKKIKEKDYDREI